MSEYEVSDSGVDELGYVWVTASGPYWDYERLRQMCAAHSRKKGYGRFVTDGATFNGRTTEVRVLYRPQ